MSVNSTEFEVIVIGAGAAGLMCAIEAGKRGRRVLVIEHAEKVGKKILISGGGRCNFTNLYANPEAYQSNNIHFCKSALSRYTQTDFIDLVKKHDIEYYEKKLGQLFCKDSSRSIVDMLLKECESAVVQIKCNCSVSEISKKEHFILTTNLAEYTCDSLVIACGGISIPKMGATGFGYEIAEQFGLALSERQAGLVPFVFDKKYLANFEGLSGISINAEVSCGNKSFRENILVTHKGISGPAILQISSYWRDGEIVTINFLPDEDFNILIEERKATRGDQELKTLISEFLPKRFVQRIFEVWLTSKPLKQLTTVEIKEVSNFFHKWQIIPAGTEGYRTAEVTVGGVATNEISSKTFESKKVPGLFFIGEVLDVTGWLGGYNFQWAWSSGYCAGQFV